MHPSTLNALRLLPKNAARGRGASALEACAHHDCRRAARALRRRTLVGRPLRRRARRTEDPRPRRARLRARRARRAAGRRDSRAARRVRRPPALHPDRRRREPPPTAPRSTTARSSATSTSTTPTSPPARPAIRATTSRRCSRPPSTRAPPAGSCLTALAVAYQVQCRLSDEAPVRAKGFDHTTQGAYAAAAGVAKALRLGEPQTANAVAIAGTALNALRVTRTGALSQWKGLAYPFTALRRRRGGLPRRARASPARPRCSRATRASWTRSPAASRSTGSTRTSSASAAPSSSATTPRSTPSRRSRRCSSCARRTRSTRPTVERIELETFQVAYDIIGGGEEGDKKQIRTKEQADHSLPYLLAVALLDGQVLPEQFAPERIVAAGRAGAAAAGRRAARRRPHGPLPGRARLPAAPPPRATARRSPPRSPTTRAS